MYENQSYNPYAQNVAIVKEYFKKPLVLVIGILYIVTIFISLFSYITMSSSLSDIYSSLFEASGIYSEFSAEEAQIVELFTNSSFLTGFVLVLAVPGLICTALYALSYFLMHFKSKNAQPNSSPKGGVTILYVLAIIGLVLLSFCALLLVLCFLLYIVLGIYFIAEPSMSTEGGAFAGVLLIVLGVVFLVLAGLMLLLPISEVTFLKSVRKSLTTVNLTSKGAVFYGVMTIIYGASNLMSAISNMFAGPAMNVFSKMLESVVPAEELAYFPTDIFQSSGSLYTVSGISALVGAVIMILTGVLAIGYKNHIKKYTNTIVGEQIPEAPIATAPVYTQPQYSQPMYNEPVVAQENAPAQGVCPQCGCDCDENAVFCNNCGTRIK